MFFNKLISFLIILTFLLSCSNNEITETDGIVVNLAYDTSCFDGISDRWNDWSNGRGLESQVQSDFNCITDGISYFLLRVRGESLGLYSAQEIFNFTEKFFKSANISKETIDDLLILKSWLMGGSESELSFEELNRLSWFVKSSLVSVKALTPLADKLFFKTTNDELTDSQAILIKKSISTVSKEFKVLSENSNARVSAERFESVFNSFLRHLEIETLKSADIKSIWSMLSILLGKSETKKLSFNPSEGLSDLVFQGFYIAMRFKYGVIDIGWRSVNSYSHLEAVVLEALSVFKKIIGFQPQNQITAKNINQFVFDAFSLLNFDFEVTETWVKDTTQILLRRYFNSESIGLAEIDKIDQEWVAFRDFYSQTLVFQGLGFKGSLIESNQNYISLNEINYRTLDFAWPMLSNSKGYVLNPLGDVEIVADYGNLFWINWQRAMVVIFLNAYTEDPQRKSKLVGINIQELQTGYADVFKILNGIDYLAESQISKWFRVFNEANLFVPRAKPDIYIDLEEGVDFFALLFSGIAFSGDLFEKMNTACPVPTKICQLNWFRSTGDEIWQEYAPGFSSYFRTISRAEWDSFSEGMEQIARDEIQTQPFERFELLIVSIAIQYIEIFLRKYDLNKDLQINFSETVNSFDKFKDALLALPQVKGTEAESDPATLLSFYTFFLRRGRLPRQVLGQYVELLGWRQRVNNCTQKTADGSFIVVNPSGCEYESSRGNLMKILAFLSNSV